MSTAKERRLKKELDRLKKQNYQVSLEEDENVVNINLDSPYSFTLKILLGQHYPFYCPEIFLNDISYKEILSLTSHQNKIFQKNNKNFCCLICSSFVCKHNWNVCKTVLDIIQDVQDHLKKKQTVLFLELWEKATKKFELPISGKLHISIFF